MHNFGSVVHTLTYDKACCYLAKKSVDQKDGITVNMKHLYLKSHR